jgi:hypothetical protein
VLVGGVVGDDVEDDADAEGVCLGDHLLRLGERAEGGVDGPVVGDVVAPVRHGRGVPGVDPDGVDAQLRQVREAGAQARDVPDAVAVAVGEAADVDLVDDGGTPPGCGRVLLYAGAGHVSSVPLAS